jgi:hypothetical protein
VDDDRLLRAVADALALAHPLALDRQPDGTDVGIGHAAGLDGLQDGVDPTVGRVAGSA